VIREKSALSTEVLTIKVFSNKASDQGAFLEPLLTAIIVEATGFFIPEKDRNLRAMVCQ
jgi:hypothetical protein